jgi:hypothetical protein
MAEAHKKQARRGLGQSLEEVDVLKFMIPPGSPESLPRTG